MHLYCDNDILVLQYQPNIEIGYMIACFPFQHKSFANSLLYMTLLEYYLKLCFYFSLQTNKPIMEKKRRERINKCLEDLKNIVLTTVQEDVSGHF